MTSPSYVPESASWIDAALFAALLAVMLFGLGSYGLYEPHEGHFAGVGREMLARGDWVVPHLNGAPYLNKPPLLYWMIASSYGLFGVHEFAARLPLALLGFAGVLLSWLWAFQVWGLRAARMSAAMLTVSAGWYLFTHQLLIDAPLSVLYLAALYAFWRGVKEPSLFRWWLGFYAALGLGVMAKGPVGLFPLAIVLIFSALRGRWFGGAKPHLAGVALMTALIAPWLILIESRVPGYLHYVLGNETFNRALDQRWPPDYSVVKVSPHVFVAIALVWMAPWSFILPQAARWSWRRFTDLELPLPQRDAILILILGALVSTVVYLPIPSRLIYYCLPSLPPFIILAAGWWANRPQAGERRVAAACFGTFGVALLVGAVIQPFDFSSIRDLASAPEVLAFIPRFMVVLGLVLTVSAVLVWMGHMGKAVIVISVGLAGAEVYNIAGFAAFDANRSSKKLVAEISAIHGEATGWTWIYEGSKEIGAPAGLAFYLGDDGHGSGTVWVHVMGDDTRRPPPKFPTGEARYLMKQSELAVVWAGNAPVLFVTDFQRTNWSDDVPNLPPNPGEPLAIPHTGNRRIYANPAARERLSKFKKP